MDLAVVLVPGKTLALVSRSLVGSPETVDTLAPIASPDVFLHRFRASRRFTDASKFHCSLPQVR
jgi:hypothetical protein